MIIPILLGIFVILAVLIIIKFLHHIVKALFLVAALFAVLVIVLGVFVMLDVKDIKEHIGSAPSKVIYTSGGKVIVAMQIDPTKLGKQDSSSVDGIHILKPSDVQEAYAKKDYAAIMGPDYKLLIVDDAFFDSVPPTTVQLEGNEVSTVEIRKILHAENASITGQMRAIAFIVMLQQAVQPSTVSTLFAGFHQGTIVLYPETALSDALKFTPSSLVGMATKYIPLPKAQSGGQSQGAPQPG